MTMNSNSPLNLFIIGPSGCGKSTQAKLIADKYNLTHLSMGQLLRDEIASKSPQGLIAKNFIDQGLWVPDETTIQVLLTNLEKIDNSDFILDGFPRLVDQGIFIKNYLAEKEKSLDLLILLDVSFEEILARRQKKGDDFQDASRSDNTPEAIAKRQASYDDTVGPIKQHFSQDATLFVIDGNRPVEPIFDDICQKIDSLIISQNS